MRCPRCKKWFTMKKYPPQSTRGVIQHERCEACGYARGDVCPICSSTLIVKHSSSFTSTNDKYKGKFGSQNETHTYYVSFLEIACTQCFYTRVDVKQTSETWKMDGDYPFSDKWESRRTLNRWPDGIPLSGQYQWKDYHAEILRALQGE